MTLTPSTRKMPITPNPCAERAVIPRLPCGLTSIKFFVEASSLRHAKQKGERNFGVRGISEMLGLRQQDQNPWTLEAGFSVHVPAAIAVLLRKVLGRLDLMHPCETGVPRQCTVSCG